MNREQWREEIKQLLRKRDEAIKLRQKLKSQLQMDTTNSVCNTISNELYELQKLMNHYDFMLERLTSDEVLDSINKKQNTVNLTIHSDQGGEYFERIKNARTT